MFLQIQGSGRLRFPDGRVVGAHFAGTNERPFTSIGRVLMDEGRVDAYVQASHRFMAGQETTAEDLRWGDLLQGRDELYTQAKRKKG